MSLSASTTARGSAPVGERTSLRNSLFGCLAIVAALFAPMVCNAQYTNDYTNLALAANGLGSIAVSDTHQNTVPGKLVDGIITSSGTGGRDNGVMWEDTTKKNNFAASATFTFSSTVGEVVNGYAIRNWSKKTDGPNRSPKAWVLEGSANGSNWTPLDTKGVDDIPDWTQGLYRFYSFQNTTPYKYYRITFSKSQNDNQYLVVSEWELYWIPEGGWTGGGGVDSSITNAANWGGTPGGTMPFNVASKQYSITNDATVVIDDDVTIAGGLDLSGASGATLDFSSGNVLTAAVTPPSSGTVTIMPAEFGTIMTGTGLSASDVELFTLPANTDGQLVVSDGALAYADVTVSWTGGGLSAAITDAGNWGGTAGETMTFSADGTYSIGEAATVLVDQNVTIGYLDISGSGAVTFTNPTDAQTGAVTTNRLTLAQISNTSSETATFDCAVDFTGGYDVVLASEAHFPGGVTATCPSDGITAQGAAAHTLMGHFNFTNEWSIAPQNVSFVLTAGSTLTGQTLTGSGTKAPTLTGLVIGAGAYAHFASVCVGRELTYVSILGKLEVDGILYCYGSSTSNYNCLGLPGDENGTGELKVGGLSRYNAGEQNGTARICVPTIYIGSQGIEGVYTTRGFMVDNLNTDAVFRATADFEISGGNTGNALSAGAGSLWSDVEWELDTGSHTVTWTAGARNKGLMTKTGSGTLVMKPCANMSTGDIVIEGGTVRVATNATGVAAGLGTGTVTVRSGATLEIDEGIALVNAVVLEAGAILKFADGAQIDGLLTLPESGTVTLDFSEGTTLPFKNAGLADGDISKFTMANGMTAAEAGYGISAGGMTKGSTYVWTGGSGADKNFSTAANWTVNGETPQSFSPTAIDTLRFDLPLGDAPVNDVQNISVNIVEFGAEAGAFAVSGNALTVGTVRNLSGNVQELAAPVAFADGTLRTYATAQTVNYSGGVTFTTITDFDDATAGRMLMGTLTMNNGTSLLTADYSVATNSVLNCAYLRGADNAGRILTILSNATVNVSSSVNLGDGGAYRLAIFMEDDAKLNIADQLRLNGVKVNGISGINSTRFSGKGTVSAHRIHVIDNYNVDYGAILRPGRLNVGAGGITFQKENVKSLAFDNASGEMVFGATADWTFNGSNGGYLFCSPCMTFDTLDAGDGTTPRTITLAWDRSGNDQAPRRDLKKINAGTLVLTNGYTRYFTNIVVQGGTLLAAATNAVGTFSPVTVHDGATFAISDGMTVANNTTTLLAGSTLSFGDVMSRDGVALGTVAADGAATVAVSGTLPADNVTTNITLAARCDAATLTNLTLDKSALVNGEKARLKVINGELVLRRPMDGMFLILR